LGSKRFLEDLSKDELLERIIDFLNRLNGEIPNFHDFGQYRFYLAEPFIVFDYKGDKNVK
jgi:hypothetical protein